MRDQRQGGPTGSPLSSADVSTDLSRSWSWMRGTLENMDGGMGFHSTGRAEDARD